MRLTKFFFFSILFLTACHGGKLRTDKVIYDDDEHPSVQVHVLNGERTEIPWTKVPGNQRYISKYGNDRALIVHIPIVAVHTTSVDKDGQPCPVNKAFRAESEDVALNPKFTRHSMLAMGGH